MAYEEFSALSRQESACIRQSCLTPRLSSGPTQRSLASHSATGLVSRAEWLKEPECPQIT